MPVVCINHYEQYETFVQFNTILVVLTHEEVLFFCKFYWPQINNTLANCYINSLNFIAMFCKSKGGGI